MGKIIVSTQRVECWGIRWHNSCKGLSQWNYGWSMNRHFLGRRGEEKCFPMLSFQQLLEVVMMDFHFMVWRNWGSKKFKHLYQVPTASRWESRDFNTSESKTHTPNRQAMLPCTKWKLRRLQSSLGIPWGIDFRTLSWILKSLDAQVPYMKWRCICI